MNKNKQTKKAKERFFVIPEQGEWCDPLKSYTFGNIKKAVDFYFNYPSQFGSRKSVITKEIGFKTKLNEKGLIYQIIPVNDVKSKCPYYHIEKYSDNSGFTVTPFRNMGELVEIGIPKKGRNDCYLAKGLELKLKD